MILFARKNTAPKVYHFRSQANTVEEAKSRSLAKLRLWIGTMSKEGKHIAVCKEEIHVRQVNNVCWECNLEVVYTPHRR